MTTTWGITIRCLPDDAPPADALDALLNALVLTADSDDPTLRAAVECNGARVELGTAVEALRALRAVGVSEE